MSKPETTQEDNKVQKEEPKAVKPSPAPALKP